VSHIADTVKDMDKSSVALENSTEFLNSIIESIPVMVFVKEAKDLKFIRFNNAAESLLGYSKKEMIGKNDYDFFPKEQASFFINKDREVLKNKIVVDIPEEEIMTKNKGKRVLHTRKVPILDRNGEPLYLLGISEDITEKTQSQAELEQINKMMIGRELKMTELKNEMSILQNQIKKLQEQK
jgi:PAS domain S-box-containing protein